MAVTLIAAASAAADVTAARAVTFSVLTKSKSNTVARFGGAVPPQPGSAHAFSQPRAAQLLEEALASRKGAGRGRHEDWGGAAVAITLIAAASAAADVTAARAVTYATTVIVAVPASTNDVAHEQLTPGHDALPKRAGRGAPALNGSPPVDCHRPREKGNEM